MQWVVLAVCVLALVYGLSRMVGKAALSRLEARPGEQVLFERDGIRVRTEMGSNRTSTMLRSFVRVTNHRVIVGAGKLSRPDKATITRIAALDTAALADLGAGVLTDGYVTFPARRADVRVEGRELRLLTSPEGLGLGIPASVAVIVDEKSIEALRNAVVEQAAEPLPANASLPGYRA